MTIRMWSELSKPDQDKLINQALSFGDLLGFSSSDHSIAHMIAIEMYSLSRHIIRHPQT